MKFGIVGCGALGSYYGAKLARDGQDVHFLLRSDYDVVRRRGLRVLSPDGDFHLNPRCARTPEEIGPCDVVLIGLKATANHQFRTLLPPLAGPHTAIVTLQNGLGNEEATGQVVSARANPGRPVPRVPEPPGAGRHPASRWRACRPGGNSPAGPSRARTTSPRPSATAVCPAT